MSRADDALLLRERVNAEADAPARRLLEAYVRAWQLVRDDLEAAALDAATAVSPVDPAFLRVPRLVAALATLDRRVRDLAREARVEVTGRVGEIAGLSVEMQQKLVAGLRGPRERDLALIVNRATEQITRDFARLPAVVRDRVRDSLLRGVAAGLGPRDVAQRIAGNARTGFGLGLSRSLVIARTELLDVSRDASLATYRANTDLVTGWRWLSTLDARTCPACWAMHNSVHDPGEQLEGHHQCRCSPVPVLVGDRPGEDDLGDPAAAFASNSATPSPCAT